MGRARGLSNIALLSVLAAFTPAVATAQSPAQSNTCAQEAASIRRAQRELPRLEIAPPGDQQIVCITLETNIVFARRLTDHVARCPRSPLARDAGAWQRTGTEYASQFNGRRCKPTIRGFRS